MSSQQQLLQMVDSAYEMQVKMYTSATYCCLCKQVKSFSGDKPIYEGLKCLYYYYTYSCFLICCIENLFSGSYSSIPESKHKIISTRLTFTVVPYINAADTIINVKIRRDTSECLRKCYAKAHWYCLKLQRIIVKNDILHHSQ